MKGDGIDMSAGHCGVVVGQSGHDRVERVGNGIR
jgi:hypothetical protein